MELPPIELLIVFDKEKTGKKDDFTKIKRYLESVFDGIVINEIYFINLLSLVNSETKKPMRVFLMLMSYLEQKSIDLLWKLEPRLKINESKLIFHPESIKKYEYLSQYVAKSIN